MISKPLRSHLIVCVGAIGFHALYALQSTWRDHALQFSILPGAVATCAAVCGGVWLVLSTSGPALGWAKTALALALIGPTAWWGVLWPAMIDLICLGQMYCGGETFHFRRMADAKQVQFALALVALAAFFCAVFSTSLQRRAERC